MNKIQIISDKNLKSLRIKKSLLYILKKSSLKKTNVIIVIGGDGFMLQTLKKNKKSKKLFYGVNSGNYGFLMNKFSSKNLIKNLNGSKIVSISPLEMTVKSNKNNTRLLESVSYFFQRPKTRRKLTIFHAYFPKSFMFLLNLKLKMRVRMDSYFNLNLIYFICKSNLNCQTTKN